MMRLRIIAAIFCAATAMPQSPADPDAMEREAMALARSRDFVRLSKLLRDPRFLARLDDPAVAKTRRLSNIMTALAANANADTAALCHTLAADNSFAADADRMPLILEVLAAVKPMTTKSANLFRSTNTEGYFASNARRLAANGSPEALGLFESMMLDGNQSIGNRIECIRFGISPRRTALPILLAAGNILSGTKDPRLGNAVIEAVFDYKREWSRPANPIPVPPAWETASSESLRAAQRLAEIARTRAALPDGLLHAVNRESAAIQTALSQRLDGRR
jgi:hypothetical protein